MEQVDEEDEDGVQAQGVEQLVVRRQVRQQGDEAQAEQDDDAADDPVHLPEELHEHQDAGAVVLLDGLIELEDDGGADAQVRQGQDGQHVRKLPLDALVAHPQGAHEDGPDEKAQDRQQYGGAHAGGGVEEGVLGPGHRVTPQEAAKRRMRS